MAGQVDAVIGAYRNFELNQMAIEGRPGRAFYLEEEGVPAYDELILVTRRDNLADPRLRPFLDAIEAAVQYMVNHPDDAWRLFVAANRDLDDELNRRAWAATLPRFALRPAALDSRRYERFAAFLKGRGLIDAVPPLAGYAVELE
jgi:putative hydroxymethylpyrimidine transport system substrate-binding protein